MNWHDYFTYNPETGDLVWKVRPRDHFKCLRACSAWNTRYAFKIAGCIDVQGYVKVVVNNRQFKAHRVIWEMVDGTIPEGIEVDHENTVKADNRWTNLRLATHTENNRNKPAQSNNTSGRVGVYFDRRRNRWYAQIVVDGMCVSLGASVNYDDVVLLRSIAEKEHFGQFAHSGC